MVDTETLGLEEQQCEEDKYTYGDDLLKHFHLDQTESTPSSVVAQTVGRYLEAILKQGYSPRNEDNRPERQAFKALDFLEFQMAIPCESHKRIGNHQQKDGRNCLHFFSDVDCVKLTKLDGYLDVPNKLNLGGNLIPAASSHSFCIKFTLAKDFQRRPKTSSMRPRQLGNPPANLTRRNDHPAAPNFRIVLISQ